jgi:cytochrome c-type biogenesis protein CcmF
VVKPVETVFPGSGLTSSQTVANFAGLDALVVAMGYAAVIAILASFRALSLRLPARFLFGQAVPVAAIHLGMAMALIAGTGATVFDTYAQKIIHYPDDFGSPIRFPDGYAVTVRLDGEGIPNDGGRGSFRAVAQVGWTLHKDESLVERAEGHTVYRDGRAPLSKELGPVRLMCEILDYRYARFVSDEQQMIHPFIHRGLWQDVQIWFPAIGYTPEARIAGPGPKTRAVADAPVVLKTYPLMFWLWVGLGCTLGGMLLLVLAQIKAQFGPRQRAS